MRSARKYKKCKITYLSLYPIYSKKENKGATGVLIVDKIGLPIDSTGNLDKAQAGLLSSIMKNTLRLQQLLGAASTES